MKWCFQSKYSPLTHCWSTPGLHRSALLTLVLLLSPESQYLLAEYSQLRRKGVLERGNSCTTHCWYNRSLKTAITERGTSKTSRSTKTPAWIQAICLNSGTLVLPKRSLFWRFWRADFVCTCSSVSLENSSMCWCIRITTSRSCEKPGLATWSWTCIVPSVDYYGRNSKNSRKKWVWFLGTILGTTRVKVPIPTYQHSVKWCVRTAQFMSPYIITMFAVYMDIFCISLNVGTNLHRSCHCFCVSSLLLLCRFCIELYGAVTHSIVTSQTWSPIQLHACTLTASSTKIYLFQPL